MLPKVRLRCKLDARGLPANSLLTCVAALSEALSFFLCVLSGLCVRKMEAFHAKLAKDAKQNTSLKKGTTE